jgi:hypothetical protein
MQLHFWGVKTYSVSFTMLLSEWYLSRYLISHDAFKRFSTSLLKRRGGGRLRCAGAAWGGTYPYLGMHASDDACARVASC